MRTLRNLGLLLSLLATQLSLAEFPVVTSVERLPGATQVLVDASDNRYTGSSLDLGGIEIRKSKPDGTLVYRTVLGTTTDDLRLGTVDNAGHVYVIGTSSGSVPLVRPIAGISQGPACAGAYFDKMQSCGDAVVIELDAAGNIVFSTLLGGSFGETISGIAVDATGKLHVTGATASRDFPTLHAAQPSASSTVGIAPCGGSTGSVCQYDAFVATIDPVVPALVQSTYLGGADMEYPYSIAVDAQGAVYVTGSTWSPNLPLLRPTHQDGRGFAASYDADGALRFATYLGRTYTGIAVAVDPVGDVLIAGHEYPGWNGFLRKLGPQGNELSDWLLEPRVATNVSGNPFHVTSMAIDDVGNAFVTGYTYALDLPVVNGVQAANAGTLDAFLTEFSSTGEVVFSTYLGGKDVDGGLAVAVDSNAAIHVAGVAHSPDFPLLDLSDVEPTGTGTGFVARMAPGSSPPLRASPQAVVFSAQLIGTTATRVVVITNSSGTAIPLDRIELDPTQYESERFSLANGCGQALPAGASCELQLTFVPQFTGELATTLLLETGAGRLRIGVRGQVVQQLPAARMSPQTTVPYAAPGTRVHSGLVRIVNFGVQPLQVTDISTTEDFGSTTDCTTSLATLESCTVYLSFSPTRPGWINGSVTIGSNDTYGPQTWTFEGFGHDFEIAATHSAASVARGSSAEYPISLTGNTGASEQAVIVALSCSGLPAGTECEFEYPQLVVGSGSSTTTLTITTSATASGMVAADRYGLTYASLGLFGLGLLLLRPQRRRESARLLLLLLATTLLASACGSGSGGSSPGGSTPPPPPSPSGTPSGNHTIVVTGTAGSLQHSTSVTLTVQ